MTQKGEDFFPEVFTRDNRIKGLLQELEQALRDEDDPAALRRAGVDLRALGDAARGRAWRIDPKIGSRSW